MRHLITLVIALLSLAASVFAEDQAKTLLVNGDFEANALAWEKRTPDDKDRALSILPEAVHSGKLGARIVNRTAVWSRWRQGAGKKLQVPAGTTVRLTGWIRTDLGPEGFAALRLYCMGEKDKILAQPATRPIAGKSDWRRVSLRAVIPEGTTYVMVYLELERAAGTADFDDVTLTALAPPKPREALNDLLLITDASPTDCIAFSLKKLYPDRLVQASPADKPVWDRYRGATVFLRNAETPFDFAALESFAASGRPVVMDLALYARARELHLRETTGVDMPRLEIVREHPATKGFRVGDSIPWFAGKKGAWTQRVIEGDIPPDRLLAKSSRGGALLVAEQVGKGTLLATDLTGAYEPTWNQPGALNKYLFLGNLLGQSVHYGTHFPERLSYADFVKAMQAAAKEYPALRFEEEGPACGAYKLCSLDLGDPQKPAFLLYGDTHGSEWEPAYGLLALARRLASRPEEKLFDTGRYCLKIIPIINPSGYDLFTRQNAAKVDLNRNGGEWWESYKGTDSNKDGTWGPGDADWKGPAPFSEPETQIFRSVCERVKPYATLDFHGNGGGRGNNRLVVLPLLARDDNEERTEAAVRMFNEAMRDRYIIQQASCTEVDQYTIESVSWDSPRPTLIETACKGRYGFLCEVPAGYQGTYGIVFQTDVVIETCLAFFKSYQ